MVLAILAPALRPPTAIAPTTNSFGSGTLPSSAAPTVVNVAISVAVVSVLPRKTPGSLLAIGATARRAPPVAAPVNHPLAPSYVVSVNRSQNLEKLSISPFSYASIITVLRTAGKAKDPANPVTTAPGPVFIPAAVPPKNPAMKAGKSPVTVPKACAPSCTMDFSKFAALFASFDCGWTARDTTDCSKPACKKSSNVKTSLVNFPPSSP